MSLEIVFCPNCDHQFPASEAFSREFEKKLSESNRAYILNIAALKEEKKSEIEELKSSQERAANAITLQREIGCRKSVHSCDIWKYSQSIQRSVATIPFNGLYR
jgi:uncharacterized Zn finger protein (UPF0148 family)